MVKRQPSSTGYRKTRKLALCTVIGRALFISFTAEKNHSDLYCQQLIRLKQEASIRLYDLVLHVLKRYCRNEQPDRGRKATGLITNSDGVMPCRHHRNQARGRRTACRSRRNVVVAYIYGSVSKRTANEIL
ncbi:hypothetical protein EVAR_100005_1 [Eumeta japonica]|uniref:Uncharacterized protein n=1 Tax=Eumeta variegata TaxID=151549 RepID=A0A4C2A5J3_EUMVA|nr:hypothetical protein EVAR_100005_1 [Eumeta japonica]